MRYLVGAILNLFPGLGLGFLVLGRRRGFLISAAVSAIPATVIVLMLRRDCSDIGCLADGLIILGALALAFLLVNLPGAMILFVEGMSDAPREFLLSIPRVFSVCVLAFVGILLAAAIGPAQYGPYVSALAISPAYDVDGTVFVKTEGDEGAATAGRLYRSTVAGDSWQAIGEHDACDPNRLHTPVDELVFSPAYEDDRTLFATTGCGLSRSTDGGDNWRIIAFESIAACSSKDNPVFSTLAVSPTFESDRTLFAGIWAGGLCRSQDGGETWQTIGLPTPVLTPPDVVVGPAAVSALAISPTFATDKTLFAALTALTGHSIDIYRSIDAGDTWQAVAETGESLWFGSVALSPVFESDNTLFWTTSDELHRSTDAGGAWHLVFEGPSRGQLSTVAFSPAFESDNTMFRTEPDKLYRSTDAGDTWRQVTSRDGIGTALVVSPGFESDNTLFMGSGDGVYRSDDAGDTWKPVNRGISHTWMIDLALQMGILLILLQIVDLVVTRYVTGRRVATWAWKALWSVAPLGVGGILIGMASMYNATGLVIVGVLVFAIVGAGFAVSRRAGESRQQTAGD